jgi:hypothetical protein
VLVLSIGNPLLGDDGVGLRLLDVVSRRHPPDDLRVEFLDGGTRGLAMLRHISGRAALVILADLPIPRLDDSLRRILNCALQALDTAAGMIVLRDAATDQLKIAVSAGTSASRKRAGEGAGERRRPTW